MSKYVLVYTKKSKKPEVGRVVTYDPDGVIGIFHRKAPLTKDLREGMLVIAKVLSGKSKERNYYILWPLLVVEDRIPPEYDKEIKVWGRPAYKALRRIKRRGAPQGGGLNPPHS